MLLYCSDTKDFDDASLKTITGVFLSNELNSIEEWNKMNEKEKSKNQTPQSWTVDTFCSILSSKQKNINFHNILMQLDSYDMPLKSPKKVQHFLNMVKKLSTTYKFQFPKELILYKWQCLGS